MIWFLWKLIWPIKSTIKGQAMPLEKNANWLVMSVPKCITIQWYGVRNISAARRLILTPSTMHVCWENFKQNYKNFWQDLHNIKKYDSKICITFFLKSQKSFLAQVSKDFFLNFFLAQVSKDFFCSHKFQRFFKKFLLSQRFLSGCFAHVSF